MDKYERDARAEIPDGYGVVRWGMIRPDDLVWDWVGKRFVRNDDPGWLSCCEFAADAVCVVRAARADTTGYESVRNYTVKKHTPADEPEDMRDMPLFNF